MSAKLAEVVELDPKPPRSAARVRLAQVLDEIDRRQRTVLAGCGVRPFCGASARGRTPFFA
jgi:hypothetical protein